MICKLFLPELFSSTFDSSFRYFSLDYLRISYQYTYYYSTVWCVITLKQINTVFFHQTSAVRHNKNQFYKEDHTSFDEFALLINLYLNHITNNPSHESKNGKNTVSKYWNCCVPHSVNYDQCQTTQKSKHQFPVPKFS